MAVLLWFTAISSLWVTASTAFMSYFGIRCFRDPSWDSGFHVLGCVEIERRGLNARKLSQSEQVFCRRIAGSLPEAPDPESDRSFLVAVHRLVAVDLEPASARIRAERMLRLESALDRQVKSVQSIRDLGLMSAVWRIQLLTSEIRVAYAGLRWFAPKFLAQFGTMGGRWLSAATFYGIWAALVYWGMARHESAATWPVIVGSVVTASTALGFVMVTIAQVRIVFGTSTVASPRTTVLGLAMMLVVLNFAVVIRTEWWRSCMDGLSDRAARLVDQADAPVLGAVLFFLGMTYSALRAVSRSCSSALKTSERIIALAFAALLIQFGIAGLLIVLTDADLLLLSRVIAGTVMVGGLFGLASRTMEWIGEYRFLHALGIEVARRGFRWWGLLLWMLALLVTSFVSPLARAQSVGWNYSQTLVTVVYIIESAIDVALILTFVPGVVVLWRYLRRVESAYKQAFAERLVVEQERELAPDRY